MLEQNVDVHNLFIDFQVAYDTVEKGNKGTAVLLQAQRVPRS